MPILFEFLECEWEGTLAPWQANYYVIIVHGGIEPVLDGPYETYEERDKVAREAHAELKDDTGIFWLDLDISSNEPTIGSYASSFFEEEPDDS